MISLFTSLCLLFFGHTCEHTLIQSLLVRPAKNLGIGRLPWKSSTSAHSHPPSSASTLELQQVVEESPSQIHPNPSGQWIYCHYFDHVYPVSICFVCDFEVVPRWHVCRPSLETSPFVPTNIFWVVPLRTGNVCKGKYQELHILTHFDHDFGGNFWPMTNDDWYCFVNCLTNDCRTPLAARSTFAGILGWAQAHRASDGGQSLGRIRPGVWKKREPLTRLAT